VIAGGLVDQVARRLAPEEIRSTGIRGGPAFVFAALVTDDPVYLHPTSFLSQEVPEYVVFHEIVRSTKGKAYMRGVTKISPGWLLQLG
jgi:hypothetical protein